MKIPHHGGEDELMDELIAAVTPEYAVITSSDEEPEADSTVDALDAVGAETYYTRVSPVAILSDGSTVTANYE